MLDDPSLYAEFADEPEDAEEQIPLEELEVLEPDQEGSAQGAAAPSAVPMFQRLFLEAVEAIGADDPDYHVLQDFARDVVGALCAYFAVEPAKGGAFYVEKTAEGAKNTERYKHDQSMRAHLVNGMLPALTIARHLAAWGAPMLRDWTEVTKRLFIAGFMLHDYAKISEAKETLRASGFGELAPPSLEQLPSLEAIFRDWCARLGLSAFLEPIGGVETYLHDLIYVSVNTQQLWSTGRSPDLLRRKSTSVDVYTLAATISHLADLIAYVVKTPHKAVSHPSLTKLITELGYDLTQRGAPAARLVFHHVAENRGVLLNFIHDAALAALTIPDQRIPLLYAPSGVVYLERAGAPPMPPPGALAAQIVEHIRLRAADTLIAKGKGAKRGNVSLQIDDSYADFFDLRTFVASSPKLVEQYIKNNKTPNRLASVPAWIGQAAMPPIPSDPKDARVDQLAEWAGLIEGVFRDRLDAFDLVTWMLNAWNVAELRPTFEAIRKHPAAVRGGGIKFWWFWAAAHAVSRRPGISDMGTLDWLWDQSRALAAALPAELPEKAQVKQDTWLDLSDYLGRILTIGGFKAADALPAEELEHYVRAKAARGGSTCAMCGQIYSTRRPNETVVAFQPGVYTSRLKIGATSNARPLCSICALEQLLRQLFVSNLDSGKTAEGQRIRYLAFYPSYFFTRETLLMMRAVCLRLSDVRLSQKELRRALVQGDLSDPFFWQQLEPFLLPSQTDRPSRRVLRQVSDSGEMTYLSVGFRGFDKPTDTEAWILPALYAFILAVSMDVKVIASESGIPLMVESDELAETIWFDGAHPSVMALVEKDHVRLDEVMAALSRLAAAYLIHLDTEFNGRDENFHRFAPMAHALAESPLYVFHYLDKQERGGQMVGAERIHRYAAYAEDLFNRKGDASMSLARKLVEQYRGFYRAKSISNTNSVLRPLSVAADALMAADLRLFSDPEALVEVTYGELYRFMDRVGKGLADGRFPKGVSAEEREQAMRVFCETFVRDVFVGIFNYDVASLRGRQINLLSSACQALYRDLQYAEWAQRGQESDDEEIDSATGSSVP
ncbi:MAG: type I-D CRISPR-associated protein Cas10d/Csc3 [Anaerolineae bacterium]|nr:type I-D CRISPR-associated protein Cas10d/Csc3 [Anaerolineae bacterium]